MYVNVAVRLGGRFLSSDEFMTISCKLCNLTELSSALRLRFEDVILSDPSERLGRAGAKNLDFDATDSSVVYSLRMTNSCILCF